MEMGLQTPIFAQRSCYLCCTHPFHEKCGLQFIWADGFDHPGVFLFIGVFSCAGQPPQFGVLPLPPYPLPVSDPLKRSTNCDARTVCSPHLQPHPWPSLPTPDIIPQQVSTFSQRESMERFHEMSRAGPLRSRQLSGTMNGDFCSKT